MKKIIITGIVIAACVVLCAALWPRNAEDKVIPVTQGKPTVSANVAATQEEPLHIIFSADTQSPGPAETKESTTEKEQASSPPDEAILEPEVTSTPEPTSTPSSAPKTATSSAPPSSDPKPGTIAVIDGNRCMWIPASAGSRMREAAPKEQRSAVPAMSLPATKSDKWAAALSQTVKATSTRWWYHGSR